MHLHEVEVLDAQTAQARVDLAPHRFGPRVAADTHGTAVGTGHRPRRPRPRVVPAQADLGQDERALAPALERAAEELLGTAEPVDGRRVERVHPEVDGQPDRAHGLVLVLRAPQSPADGERAEAHDGEL